MFNAVRPLIIASVAICGVCRESDAANSTLESLDAKTVDDRAREVCAPRTFNEMNCRRFITALEDSDDPQYQKKEYQLALAEAYTDLAMSVESEFEQSEARRRKNEIYRGLVKNHPTDTEILGQFAYTHEDDDATLAILDRLLAIDPGDFAAHWISGRILVNRTEPKDVQKGLEHLRAAYETADGTRKLSMAAELLGNLQRRGFDDDAKAFARTLPNDLQIQDRLSAADAAVRSDISISRKVERIRDLMITFCHVQYLLIETETCRQAVNLAEELEQREPGNAAVLRLSIEGYERLKDGKFGQYGKYDPELRAKYEELLQLTPVTADLLYSYSAHVENPKRLEVLERAISENPNASPEIRASLAEALIDAGRETEAIEQLRHAFADPAADYSRIYGEQLALLLREQGFEAEAEDVERKLQDQ